MSITASLGMAFLLIGTSATFLMLHLWGYPYDESTHTSSAPKSLMRLHRLLGYSFATIYVVMMCFMVPRLWNYVGDMSARSVAHAMLALGIGITLLIKISILRFFPHFRQHLPTLGVSILVMTWLMIGLPLFTLGWEWSLSRQASRPDNIARMKRSFRSIDQGGEEGWSRTDIPEALRIGRATLHAECIRCHDLNKVLHKERAGEEWRKIVASMTKKARKFGPVSEQQERNLAMYLTAARGRDAEAQPPRKELENNTPPVPAAPTPTPVKAGVQQTSIATPTTTPAERPDHSAALLALLESRCSHCHAGGDAPEGLRLVSIETVKSGSDNGPVVVAGDPDSSELVRRIRGQSLPQMPMDGPPYLTDSEIALVEEWVRSLDAPNSSAIVQTTDSPPAREESSGAIPVVASATGAVAQTIPNPVSGATQPPARGEGFINYTHVRTILRQNCVRCHAPEGKLGSPPEGLILTRLDLMLSTAVRPVIVPRSPGASLLLRHIRGLEDPQMPFEGPPFLDATEVELVSRWIEEGARGETGKPSQIPAGREVRLRGTLSAPNAIDGVPFQMDAHTEVRDAVVGSAAEVRARVRSDGALVAERVRGR